MIKSRSVSLCVAAIAAIGFCAYGFIATLQQQPATPQVLHDASAAVRDQQETADDQLELGIITNGLEPDKAGFHLLRPVTDPLWSAQYGRLQPHFDYRWYDVPVRYSDVEYQRRIPFSEFPGFIEPYSALVSQKRNISNSLGSATSVAESGGTFRVIFSLLPRGVAALQALLQPTTTFPASGELADWYRMTIPNGSPSTTMMVTVVSNHIAYLPISVQDVIASATSTGASVVVANRLSAAEAADLASRLNAP